MRSKLSCLAAVCLLFAAAGSAGAEELGQGKVLFEYWFGIPGTSVDDDLRPHPDFPDNPHDSEWRDGFESRVNWLDNFGTRARAFLTAPETGEYTFWVAGDDNCQLWLSTDADAANAVKIGEVPGWTAPKEWFKYPEQQSVPILLEAGQTYYIEALMKEGGGGDSVEAAWAGPGIGDEPTIIKGDYVRAYIRDPEPLFHARNPKPADGAQEWTELFWEWTPGLTAVAHNLYVGMDPDLGEDDFVAAGTPDLSMHYHFAGLVPEATYYWRVDSIDADGEVFEGNVWSFTVKPVKAYNPRPYDGALWRPTDLTASWSPGWGAVSHIVYAGTDEAAVAAGDESALLATLTEPSLDASALLELGTTYYWRVDQVDGDGEVVEGDVWTFSTMMEGRGGATYEVWLDIPGGAVSALTNHPNFPRSPDLVEFLPSDFEAPLNWEDNYGARISAWLHVPVAGEYTFWIASDDDSVLLLGVDKPSAVPIASVSGWTPSRAWDNQASQKSDPIYLDEGVYYLAALHKEGTGGDNCAVAWQGPAVPQRELVGAGFIEPFINVWADDPHPVDGAEGVPDLPVLDWQAGEGAVESILYLSANKGAVEAGDENAFVAFGEETVFVPDAALNWNTTYYWRVDSVDAYGNVVPGYVWSFNVADYIPVVNGPVTIDYDNTDEPFATEFVSGLAVPLDSQDWTKNGVNSLQLEIKGDSPKFAVDNGTISLQGAGADIWGNRDEFRYAHKTLTGDGTIIARVVDTGTGTHAWAKGGVMIRQSLDHDSPHAMVALTGGDGGGAALQWRPVAGGGSESRHNPVPPVAAPYWVKIERVGNEISGFRSEDGIEWVQFGDTPITVELEDPVFIGLCALSHVSGVLRTFTFDNVAATGDVTGDWTVSDVGVAQGGNDPAPIYVAVVDSDGNMAVVNHPGNPNVTLATDWLTWKIPTSQFAGVNMKSVTNLVVGVGDGLPGGTGAIQVRNARVVKPFAITVRNHSFETVPAPLHGFHNWEYFIDRVADWNGTAGAYVSRRVTRTHGSWAAGLLKGQSIWNTTDHVIVEGEEFEVTVSAIVQTGVLRDNRANLRVRLYYDDDGVRVPVATRSVQVLFNVGTYSLSFATRDARAAVGHKLGVEIANISPPDCLLAVDNVRLRVK